MYNRTYRAVRAADHVEIEAGDRIVDFRGDVWIFEGITRHPGDGTATTGKVLASRGEDRRELYARVFDLEIVPRLQGAKK